MLRTVVLCLLVAWPSVLHAQEAAPQDPGMLDEEARRLFEAGAIAFQQGRFDNALEYFERAHGLSGRSVLLYNIGVAADRLRRDDKALSAFERYLEAVPDARNANEIRARIEALRDSAERQRALAAAPAAPPEPQAPPAAAPLEPEPGAESGAVPSTTRDARSGGSSAVPVVLLTAGGVGVVGGVITLLVGQSRRSEIEDADLGSSWADVEQYEDADTFTGIGAVLLAAGAVTTAIGIVLALDPDDEGIGGPTLGLGPGSVTLRGAL